VTDVEFKAIEDRAVAEAIALQVTAGIDVTTDGDQLFARENVAPSQSHADQRPAGGR
jgi:methionine synthase II (cobalamin-independent)